MRVDRARSCGSATAVGRGHDEPPHPRRAPAQSSAAMIRDIGQAFSKV
jgi:hypothetical protein